MDWLGKELFRKTPLKVKVGDELYNFYSYCGVLTACTLYEDRSGFVMCALHLNKPVMFWAGKKPAWWKFWKRPEFVELDKDEVFNIIKEYGE